MKNVRYLPENVTFDDVFSILKNVYKVQFDRIKIYRIQGEEQYADNVLKFNYDNDEIITIRETRGQHLYRVTNCKYGVEEIREEGKLIRKNVYTEKEESGMKVIMRGTFNSDEACTSHRKEFYNEKGQLIEIQTLIDGSPYHYNILYDINGKVMSVSLWRYNIVISLEDLYMRFDTVSGERVSIMVANRRKGLKKISFRTKEEGEEYLYIITFKGGD